MKPHPFERKVRFALAAFATLCAACVVVETVVAFSILAFFYSCELIYLLKVLLSRTSITSRVNSLRLVLGWTGVSLSFLSVYLAVAIAFDTAHKIVTAHSEQIIISLCTTLLLTVSNLSCRHLLGVYVKEVAKSKVREQQMRNAPAGVITGTDTARLEVLTVPKRIHSLRPVALYTIDEGSDSASLSCEAASLSQGQQPALKATPHVRFVPQVAERKRNLNCEDDSHENHESENSRGNDEIPLQKNDIEALSTRTTDLGPVRLP